MNADLLRLAGTGAGFVIMFLSGFWLGHTGKPYGTFAFTIHKLIGVGMGIFLFVIVRGIYQATSLMPSEIMAVIVTGLSFVATATTGSLLSIPASKPVPNIVSILNKVFPYVTVLCTSVTLYILLNRT